MNKVDIAKEIILEYATPKSAVMCSFGKDSIVLLSLLRTTIGELPVIHHRLPWFPAKNEFADSVIRSSNLTVHDYPPAHCGVKYNDDRLELVARYAFGENGRMDLPVNTEAPLPRREFVCGLYDCMMRPKTGEMVFPWDTVFMGHKSSDVDPFEGPVPLKSDSTTIGGVTIAFPLKDWTDDDVWDYIEQHNVPYDRRRYSNRAELPDKWLNPDYLHACTKCIDPRQTEPEVFCPKFKTNVPNMGKSVLRLQHRPEYWQEVA